MVHPLHPDSPDYPAMLAAGRVRERVARRSLGCDELLEDKYGPVSCPSPAPNIVVRSDGRTVGELRRCDAHARIGQTIWPGHTVYLIAKAFRCSVCDAEADYRSRLDHDGRCDRCRP